MTSWSLTEGGHWTPQVVEKMTAFPPALLHGMSPPHLWALALSAPNIEVPGFVPSRSRRAWNRLTATVPLPALVSNVPHRESHPHMPTPPGPCQPLFHGAGGGGQPGKGRLTACLLLCRELRGGGGWCLYPQGLIPHLYRIKDQNHCLPHLCCLPPPLLPAICSPSHEPTDQWGAGVLPRDWGSKQGSRKEQSC